MDNGLIIILLAVFTLGAAIIFAVVSKRKTEERIDDPKADKSTLAADTASHGKPADVEKQSKKN